MMKNFLRSLAALAIISWSGLALAEVAVIVHPSAGFDSLTADEISRLFMGKSKSFPNGSPATPLNQDDGSATRDVFNQEVCNKSPSQYKAYWSKLVFTGKGTPPKDSGDDTAVKALVAGNPKMIGYVDASVVDDSLKVIHKLP
jgi:ABC-type phosphate transport system substrate-binding protein